MKDLIRKEIIVNRKHFFSFLLLYHSAIAVLVDSVDKRYVGFIVTVTFVTFMTILTVLGDENKNKTDIIFLSLPIDRGDIIKSRYIVYGLFPICYSISLYIITMIINLYTMPYDDISVGFEVVIVAMGISLIIQSIIIPLVYKFKKVLLILFLLFGAIYLLGIFTLMNHERELVLNIDYGSWGVILLLISMLAYFISFKISLRVNNEQYIESS